jgi:hypothetical protein
MIASAVLVPAQCITARTAWRDPRRCDAKINGIQTKQFGWNP